MINITLYAPNKNMININIINIIYYIMIDYYYIMPILFLLVIVLSVLYIRNQTISYKDRLTYLDTPELNYLCESTKDKDNNIMIMMFTSGHIDEARNCIYSYHKSTGKNNILVFALDKETKEAMDRQNISCYYNSLFYDEAVKESDYATKQFDIICYNKLLVIYVSLLQAVNVLWSDTDIVYFKDPFKKLYTIQKPISIQNNINQDNINNNLCAGFMFFKNTEQSKLFLQRCIDHINNYYEYLLTSKDASRSGADQGIINKFNDSNIINVLSVEEFPNGLVWWGTNDSKPLDFDRNKSYMVHNNYIIGLDNKVKRFKESGLWFI